MSRVQKLIKKKSKRVLTLEAKHGVEEAQRLIKLWAGKAGATKGKPKGFAVTGLAIEAGRKGGLKSRESKVKDGN